MYKPLLLSPEKGKTEKTEVDFKKKLVVFPVARINLLCVKACIP
ncbi:Hypothetical protein Minf_0377 [Methylacidiphilum infernorum V4]|uniref:Uncharacterized protein n=1 Tax=Methylacidiphilum infernorum (isolate V4) TaxID=481448 RepID=B3DYR3_METI4|nr:Hypothetical protein Minf_0377 [Methylacidiphilum infernorum V4]